MGWNKIRYNGMEWNGVGGKGWEGERDGVWCGGVVWCGVGLGVGRSRCGVVWCSVVRCGKVW